MTMTKLHLGCGWMNFGTDWIHVDQGSYEHLDYDCNVAVLPFDDNYADVIYASHVLAYFDRMEVIKVLTEWNRVLKPGGTLRLATPDFGVMSELYKSGEINMSQMLGPMYGKMNMKDVVIYHKTTYDFADIGTLLRSCGFTQVHRYDWRDTDHSEHDDHSQAYIPHMDKDNGTLISLNVECTKE